MATVSKKPLYQVINGIRSPAMFSPVLFKEALTYKARPDDVIIVTFPKCGTTWMQSLVLHILRRGQPLTNPSDFAAACPFIDMLGEEGVRRMPRPGAIKTHLPYTHMPYSPDTKYIFVARNPKDACVSLYHHTRMLPGLGYSEGQFDDFFELFMAGEVEYNDYFDHLLSWFPHRNDKNVFYTTYENMKKDTTEVVLKLGQFLGKEYSELLENDNNVLNNVLRFGSFQYMKDNISDTFDSYGHREAILNDPNALEGIKFLARYTCTVDVPEKRPPMEFVRKGIVGDWRNFFSPEQVERLDRKFTEKTKGTEIELLWESKI